MALIVPPRPQHSVGLTFTDEGWFAEGTPLSGTGYGLLRTGHAFIPLDDGGRFLALYYADNTEVDPTQTDFDYARIVTVADDGIFESGADFLFPIQVQVREGLVRVSDNRVLHARPDRYLRDGGNPNLGSDYWEAVDLTLVEIGDDSASVVSTLRVETRTVSRNQPWHATSLVAGDVNTFILTMYSTFDGYGDFVRKVQVSGDVISIAPEIASSQKLYKPCYAGGRVVFGGISGTQARLSVLNESTMTWEAPVSLPTTIREQALVALDDSTVFVAAAEPNSSTPAMIWTFDVNTLALTALDNSAWPVELLRLSWYSANPYVDPRRPPEGQVIKGMDRWQTSLHLVSPGVIAGVGVLTYSWGDDNEKLVWFWDVAAGAVLGWGIVKPPRGLDENPDELFEYDEIYVSEPTPKYSYLMESAYSGGLLVGLVEGWYTLDDAFTESTWLTFAKMVVAEPLEEYLGARRRFVRS